MISRTIISAIVTIALTLLSFGHQSLSPETEAQVQSYLLAGGSWSDLCGDGDDPLAGVGKCTACVISQSCVLPPPLGTHQAAEMGTALVWTVAAVTSTQVTQAKAHPARAPPIV